MNIKKRLSRYLQLTDLKCFLADLKESRERLNKLKQRVNILDLVKIRISVKAYSFYKNIWIQSKNREGIVKRSIFVSNFYPDLNVVINSANRYVPMISKSGQNWLIHIEPPGYVAKLNYNNINEHKKYTRVYTSDPNLYKLGGKYIASPPYVHWHIEVSGYTNNIIIKHDLDFLEEVDPPKKDVNLVALNSNISALPGHKLRAEFIKKLCEHNFQFLLYGGTSWAKYHQYIDNAPNGKWPIYSKSRYVLVIENEVAPYYWSEKITDAMLCWAIPIYYGCQNLENYFPKNSFIRLDVTNENAINNLQKIINSDYYEKNINALAKARELILKKYNLLNFIESEFESYVKGAK